MAEKGAHLSATYAKKPSIFELLAQDSLANTFHPALKHGINFLVAQNPGRYAFLHHWFEECYFLFNLMIQGHYLRNYDCTFAEKFYNLKRVPLINQVTNLSLPVKSKLLSLFFSVCIPYLRSKFRTMSENIENGEEFKNNIHVPPHYQKLFILFNTVLHIAVESLYAIYYIRYMMGRSDTHSLALHLAGLTLVYFHENFTADICWKSTFRDLFLGKWRSLFVLLRLLRNSFGRSLELFAFFIQFLNWWHSEDLHSKFWAYPIPPAPHTSLDAAKIKPMNLCPLCLKKFRIPTALPVSGYVFCFNCVRKYVAQHRKCPVTNLPSKERDLVRIYSDVLDS